MEIKKESKEVFEYFYNLGLAFDDYDNFGDMVEDDFNFDEIDTNIEMYFLNSETDGCLTSFGQLKEFYYTLKGEIKKEELYVIFESKCLYRVHCDNYEVLDILYYDENSTIKSLDLNIKNEDYTISFGMGISELSFINIVDNKYSEYYPPFDGKDIFIMLEGSNLNQLNEKDILGIVESYLFQIKCSFNIDISLSPRHDGESDYLDDFKFDSLMRPLLLGEGIFDVVSLFNKASFNADLTSSILRYTQVLEYISLTVVNRKLVEDVTNKLNSASVFSPDSNYIVEMGDIFLSNYKLKQNDGELIKAVVTSCCDIFELKKVAPNFIKKIKQINEKSKLENRIKALDEIADYIVNTRNRLSHSKPNYQNNGKISATDEELPEFLELLKTICEQSIRWFGNIPEKDRITKANSYR